MLLRPGWGTDATADTTTVFSATVTSAAIPAAAITASFTVVIYQGELESLRRFKDDAQDVRNGVECGVGVKDYNDVRAGDLIEVYEITEVQRTL